MGQKQASETSLSSRFPVEWNWLWKRNLSTFKKPWRHSTYTVLNKECVLNKDNVATTSLKKTKQNKNQTKRNQPTFFFYHVYSLFAWYWKTSRYGCFKKKPGNAKCTSGMEASKEKWSRMSLVYMWKVTIPWLNQAPWSMQYTIGVHRKLNKTIQINHILKNEP